MNIVIEIFEADPIDLLNKTNLSRADFAAVLGIEKQTLDRWCCGMRTPSKQARRLAGELAQKWGIKL